MTPTELYTMARAAGFPPDTAEKMVAIALKESGGNPRAFNGVPPDRSYGLYQINMLGALSADRIRWFGLQREEDLFDPWVNTQAAYKLWAGSDANLDRHWYIYRDSRNAAKFAQYLPQGKQARAQVEGGSTADFSVTGYGGANGSADGGSSGYEMDWSLLDRADMLTGSRTTTYLVGAVFGLALLVALRGRD